MWRQKLGGIVGGGNRAIQSLRTSARIRKINANATVVTEVGPGGSAADIEYWKQGSADMYTQDALEKRAMARDDPQVRHWLQVWWETAHRSLKKKAKPKGRAKAQSPKSKASRKKAAAKATESDAELDVSAHEISKAQYVAMMKKLYKVMIEEYDEDDATACAEEDWETDAKGATSLGREGFCDALFELADTWTKTCDAEEYADFLQRLLDQVAMSEDGGTVFFWRDDDGILFDPRFDEDANTGATENAGDGNGANNSDASTAAAAAASKGGANGLSTVTEEDGSTSGGVGNGSVSDRGGISGGHATSLPMHMPAASSIMRNPTPTIACTPDLGLTPNSKGSGFRRTRALTPGRSPAMRSMSASSRAGDGHGRARTSRFAASGLLWRRVEATDPELSANVQEWCSARTEVLNDALAGALLSKSGGLATHDPPRQDGEASESHHPGGSEGESHHPGSSKDGSHHPGGSEEGFHYHGTISHVSSDGQDTHVGGTSASAARKWVSFTREEWDAFGVDATLGAGGLSYMVYVKYGADGPYFTPSEAAAFPARDLRGSGHLYGQATPRSSSRRRRWSRGDREGGFSRAAFLSVKFLARLRARASRQHMSGMMSEDGPRRSPQSAYACDDGGSIEVSDTDVGTDRGGGTGGCRTRNVGSREGAGTLNGVTGASRSADSAGDRLKFSGDTNMHGRMAVDISDGGDAGTTRGRGDEAPGGARSRRGNDCGHGDLHFSGGNGGDTRYDDGNGARSSSGSMTRFLGSPVRWTRAASTRPHKGEATPPRAPPARRGLQAGRPRPSALPLTSQPGFAPRFKPPSPRSSLFAKLSLRSPSRQALDATPSAPASQYAVPPSLLGEISKTRIHKGVFLRETRPQRLPPVEAPRPAGAAAAHATTRTEVPPVGWADYRGLCERAR